jgi:hypothetical protein
MEIVNSGNSDIACSCSLCCPAITFFSEYSMYVTRSVAVAPSTCCAPVTLHVLSERVPILRLQWSSLRQGCLGFQSPTSLLGVSLTHCTCGLPTAINATLESRNLETGCSVNERDGGRVVRKLSATVSGLGVIFLLPLDSFCFAFETPFVIFLLCCNVPTSGLC